MQLLTEMNENAARTIAAIFADSYGEVMVGGGFQWLFANISLNTFRA